MVKFKEDIEVYEYQLTPEERLMKKHALLVITKGKLIRKMNRLFQEQKEYREWIDNYYTCKKGRFTITYENLDDFIFLDENDQIIFT